MAGKFFKINGIEFFIDDATASSTSVARRREALNAYSTDLDICRNCGHRLVRRNGDSAAGRMARRHIERLRLQGAYCRTRPLAAGGPGQDRSLADVPTPVPNLALLREAALAVESSGRLGAKTLRR